MQSPLSIVCHLAVLVAVAYHAFTWFKLFLLTMPPIVVNGKSLSRASSSVAAGRPRLGCSPATGLEDCRMKP